MIFALIAVARPAIEFVALEYAAYRRGLRPSVKCCARPRFVLNKRWEQRICQNCRTIYGTTAAAPPHTSPPPSEHGQRSNAARAGG